MLALAPYMRGYEPVAAPGSPVSSPVVGSPADALGFQEGLVHAPSPMSGL